ncbi:hypothetical protein SAMN05445756_0521 [Kytococcus aerolatus]|uniref:DUF559 domain-containing protein n=1 Tax=Kytococcus aerolatus TaxID=592308 RepID=A0A212T6H0_9MICO|nr:hypothetical protein [Kytococcus aerolatus]SNC61628.1 hypothetical protein SAMN05445756_0521 [Kytococcus aerolatus]
MPAPDSTPEHFTVHDARTHGWTRARLRSARWHRPTYGARSRTAPTEHAHHVAAVMTAVRDDAAASCHSAAVLHGLPLPRPVRPTAPVHLMVPTGQRIRRPEVVAHTGLEGRELVTVQGLRVLSPVDTWVGLAAPGHLDTEALVVVGDHLVRRQHGQRLEALDAALERLAGTPGIRRAREARRWVRRGSRSPRESVARFAMMQWGLPEPELNADVCDAHGAWLGEVDFVWRAQGVVCEYDGAFHYDPEHLQRTLRRRERLVDAGWSHLTLTRDDMHPARRAAWLRDLERRLAGGH